MKRQVLKQNMNQKRQRRLLYFKSQFIPMRDGGIVRSAGGYGLMHIGGTVHIVVQNSIRIANQIVV